MHQALGGVAIRYPLVALTKQRYVSIPFLVIANATLKLEATNGRYPIKDHEKVSNC